MRSRCFPGPIIELHISNIHRREAIYHNSLVSRTATAVIAGLGALRPPASIAARPARRGGPGRTTSPSSIPARRPAQAGFRACRRCRPDEVNAAHPHAALIEAACRRIEAADEPLSLAELAAEADMSPYHFHRVFKAITGLTPKAYAGANRANRMRDALAGKASVTAAIYDAGYGASSRFYEKSGDILGMTATAYRNGGQDAEIRFAVGECSLGAILVARSAKGVCALTLGDDPDALVRDLQDRFPNAELVGGDMSSRPRRQGRGAGRRSRPPASACRSTCAARRSSSACGPRCRPSRRGRP
jgi:methylphosphotriester-DNA--protein-cysteine methyltransferase